MPRRRAVRRRRGPQASGRSSSADESGLAVSLWVVMIVPVAVLAALASIAAPQRLAAERSLRDAADDMAATALALERQLHIDTVYADTGLGLPTIAAACDSYDSDDDGAPDELERLLKPHIDRRDDLIFERDDIRDERADLEKFLEPPDPDTPPADDEQLPDPLPSHYEDYDWITEYVYYGAARNGLTELQEDFNSISAEIEELPAPEDLESARERCGELTGKIYTALSHAGIDVTSLRGFQTNMEQLRYLGSSADSADGAAWQLCEPDRNAPNVTYAVLSAQWNSAGWAAAQIWPHGITLSAEGLSLVPSDDGSDEPAQEVTLPDPEHDDDGCLPAREYAAEHLTRHSVDASVPLDLLPPPSLRPRYTGDRPTDTQSACPTSTREIAPDPQPPFGNETGEFLAEWIEDTTSIIRHANPGVGGYNVRCFDLEFSKARLDALTSGDPDHPDVIFKVWTSKPATSAAIAGDSCQGDDNSSVEYLRIPEHHPHHVRLQPDDYPYDKDRPSEPKRPLVFPLAVCGSEVYLSSGGFEIHIEIISGGSGHKSFMCNSRWGCAAKTA